MLKGTFSYWSRTGQSSYALRIIEGGSGGGGVGVTAGLRALLRPWLLSVQPNILEISVRNQIERTIIFGSVQLELPLWPNPLILISQTKFPFPFDNFLWLSPVPLFGILLTRTITKCVAAWVWSVQPECTVPFGTWNLWNFKLEFLLNGKGPLWPCQKLEFSNGWCNSEQKFWVLKQFTSFIIFQL